MFKLIDVSPVFAIREMDFLNDREVMYQTIAEDRAPRLPRSDLCFAINAPSGWSCDHDESALVFLDQNTVERTLGHLEYQLTPPTQLDDLRFREWAGNVCKYLQLSITAPSLLCMDFADLLRVLEASPSRRFVANVVAMDEWRVLQQSNWASEPWGLLYVVFENDSFSLNEFVEQLAELNLKPREGTPVISSIKIQPRHRRMALLMAGTGHFPVQAQQ